jgi:NACalpha-BTF3-like transcription factor
VQASSVAQIREAAEQLTAKGFGDFELSDATTGRLIPVQPAVRQALVTAIALHARGREHLASRDDGAAAEALEFLAEADRCFERCREGGAWQLLEQLRNFGELQLDICWAYALLGDTERLPDAEVRLGAAERMISRQVDKNFLTLAEVKAEQGHTLPPEVLPSVRLWLLRGIAHSCRGNFILARTDLNRAALFLESLKVDEETVSTLLTMGASRAQAVAALRRCGGSPDRAAEDFLAAARHRKVARGERDAQRKFGQTVDGSFVDPDLVSQLEGMGVEQDTAVAALKKANNDVAKALDVIQTEQREQDAVSQQQQPPVDELALASVLSLLGPDFSTQKAEAALRASGGDVEDAMLMLTAGESADDGAQIEGSPAPGTTSTPSASRNETVVTTASEGGGLGAATEKGLKAVWQFEQAANEWQNYPADAAGVVEAAFQRWRRLDAADPAPASSSVVDVESGNWKYRVDLGAMKQVNIQNLNRTSRRVRRRLLTPQDAAASDAQAELEEQARQVVERELGRCLRRDDPEDDIAGASLVDETFLVQKHLSNL